MRRGAGVAPPAGQEARGSAGRGTRRQAGHVVPGAIEVGGTGRPSIG